jgi:hypothetical protein
MEEAVVKTRSGGPHDDPGDLARAVWAGVVPLSLRVGPVEPDGPQALAAPEPWAGAEGLAFGQVLKALQPSPEP